MALFVVKLFIQSADICLNPLGSIVIVEVFRHNTPAFALMKALLEQKFN